MGHSQRHTSCTFDDSLKTALVLERSTRTLLYRRYLGTVTERADCGSEVSVSTGNRSVVACVSEGRPRARRWCRPRDEEDIAAD